jgi:hypothetical protein
MPSANKTMAAPAVIIRFINANSCNISAPYVGGSAVTCSSES